MTITYRVKPVSPIWKPENRGRPPLIEIQSPCGRIRDRPGPTFSTVMPPFCSVVRVAEKSSSLVASGPKVSEPSAPIERWSNSQAVA